MHLKSIATTNKVSIITYCKLYYHTDREVKLNHFQHVMVYS